MVGLRSAFDYHPILCEVSVTPIESQTMATPAAAIERAMRKYRYLKFKEYRVDHEANTALLFVTGTITNNQYCLYLSPGAHGSQSYSEIAEDWIVRHPVQREQGKAPIPDPASIRRRS